MYILMKDGKYFTGQIAFRNGAGGTQSQNEEEDQEYLDFMAWTRHPSAAKVWERNRGWAERAAAKWGGEVVEIQSQSH